MDSNNLVPLSTNGLSDDDEVTISEKRHKRQIFLGEKQISLRESELMNALISPPGLKLMGSPMVKSHVGPAKSWSPGHMDKESSSKPQILSKTKKDSLILAHHFLFGSPSESQQMTIENLNEELNSILLHSGAQLRTLVPAIFRTIQSVLKIEKCAIFINRQEGKCDLFEDHASVLEFCSVEEGIVGQTISTGVPIVLLSKAHQHPYYSINVDQREGFRPSGMLCFPLRGTGVKPAGALQASSSTAFSHETVTLFESILAPIEAAINHALRIENSRKNRSTVLSNNKASTVYSMLFDAVPAVISDPAIRESVMTSCEKFKSIVNCEYCSLYMVDWLQDNLHLMSTPLGSGTQPLLIESAGFMSHVLLTGESANSSSLSLADHVGSTLYEAKSILVVPIHNKSDDIIGLVELINKIDKDHFDRNDEVLLEHYCYDLQMVLEQALVFRNSLNKERQKSNKLFEVSAMIADELDAMKLIQRVTTLTSELLESDRATIFLVDEETNDLWSCGKDDEIITVPRGKGISGEVASTGKIINITDAYKNPLFNRKADEASGYRTKSVLCIPIRNSSGIIVGVAQAINKKRPKGHVLLSTTPVCFDTHDEELLTAICIYIGITYNNSQLLMQATREQRKSLALLDLLKATSMDSKNLKEICQNIILSVSKIINAERGALFIANDVTGDFYCPSGFDVKSFSFIANERTVVGQVSRTRKIVVIDDFEKDSRLLVDRYQEFSGYKPKSIICCPCIDAGSGKVIAVLQLMNKSTSSIVRKFQVTSSDSSSIHFGAPFTIEDQTLISAMAIEVSKALRNVSLEAAYDSLFRDDKIEVDQVASYISQYTHKEQRRRTSSVSDSISSRLTTSVSNISIEHTDSVNSWDFNPGDYSYQELIGLAFGITVDLGYISFFGVDNNIMKNFLTEVSQNYISSVPYHNFLHGFSVFHICYLLVTNSSVKSMLDIFQLYALAIAALCHDVGHPGVNNQFLVTTGSQLALRYNDKSVLENMHAALTFKLVNKEGCNIFKNVAPDKFKILRKTIIKCILATDMAEHFDMTIQIKENLNPSTFNIETHSSLLLCTLMHSADISNPVLCFELSKSWSDKLILEFNMQAALEKEKGIPVTAMFDTVIDTPGQGKLNINFIDYVVLPLWEALVNFLPVFRPQMLQIRSNRSRWQKLLEPDDPLRNKNLVLLPEELEMQEELSEDESPKEISPVSRRRSMWL